MYTATSKREDKDARLVALFLLRTGIHRLLWEQQGYADPDVGKRGRNSFLIQDSPETFPNEPKTIIPPRFVTYGPVTTGIPTAFMSYSKQRSALLNSLQLSRKFRRSVNKATE